MLDSMTACGRDAAEAELRRTGWNTEQAGNNMLDDSVGVGHVEEFVVVTKKAPKKGPGAGRGGGRGGGRGRDEGRGRGR